VKRRVDLVQLLGVAAAVAVCLVAQVLEGGRVASLWQPTAAFIVFGGTAIATFVSYPMESIRRTGIALRRVFSVRQTSLDPIIGQLYHLALRARQRGLLSLEGELDRMADPFLQAAIGLVVDGTNPAVCRQILEIDSHAQREAADRPAEVLETAAGYSPTLGILGAVLGLIHVMEALSEPSRLGAGIAVAFVATVYGVGFANLVLLPLATKLRGVAREAERGRELVIEGALALQEGLSPQLLDLKLRGFLASASEHRRWRAVA
jgi:chemotaxis protein MotA